MSTTLSATVDLPAPVEAVLAVLTSPQWPAANDARLHDGSTLVSSLPTPDGGHEVVQRRRLPDGVPSFLLRFAPKDGQVTQTDVWAPPSGEGREGTWAVTFPGSPGSIGGVTRLEPTPTGCRWVVTGTVRVGIPLVGGRAEGFLAPLVERLVRTQGEVLRSLL